MLGRHENVSCATMREKEELRWRSTEYVPGECVRHAMTWRREENQPRHLMRWYTLQTKTTTLRCHIHYDNTTIHRTLLGDEAPWPILKRLKNMPKTFTFIPHRMRMRFAGVYSSKLCQKQQDEEERRNANSNQVEDKEQTYLRRDEQSSKRTTRLPESCENRY